MNKLLISASILFLLVACQASTTPDKITTLKEGINVLESLDKKYNTSFRKEQLHTQDLTRSNINNYLNDLQQERKRISNASGKQELLHYLFEFRQQSLQAQYKYQTAWVEIGAAGRTKDGFTCSDGPQINRFNRLVMNSLTRMHNATKILDSILTQSEYLQSAIGIDDAKPAIYNTPFGKFNNRLKHNQQRYKKRCTSEVQQDERT